MVRYLFLTLLLGTALTTQACGQSIEAVDKQTTDEPVAVIVTPEAPTMTLEEIRAEQKIIEAKIAEINAKGELERADKITLLNLKDRLIHLIDLEMEFQDKVIQSQKKRLAMEFSKTRSEIQD